MRNSGIRSLLLLLISGCLISSIQGQSIREFKIDTASFISELRMFTGTTLQTDERPDFERFIQLFDSLPYEHQLEIMEVSNLMLEKKCRPIPQFITFQRIIMEFFIEDKTGHG